MQKMRQKKNNNYKLALSSASTNPLHNYKCKQSLCKVYFPFMSIATLIEEGGVEEITL